MAATLTAPTTTLLPTPFVLTDHLAIPVDHNAEATCPGCGDYIGQVNAYQAAWVDVAEIDVEIYDLFNAHLTYDARPDCGE